MNKASTPATVMSREVVTFLNLNGFICFSKYNGGVYDPVLKIFRKKKKSEDGISDVIGIKKGTGRGLAIELKASKGDTPTPEQIRFVEDWKKAGGIAFICYSWDDFIDKLIEFEPSIFYRLDPSNKRKYLLRNTPPKPPAKTKN